MDRDWPYKIQAVDLRAHILNGFGDIRQVENTYQVYWWGTIALGHHWGPLQESQLNGSPAFAAVIWEAIYPTLQCYSARQKTVPFDQLQAHWKDQQWHRFSKAMEAVLSHYYCSQHVEVDVSLVICTRNRALVLKNCLDSLVQLSVRPREILVVDNAPDNDQTEKLVAGYPSIRYILEEKKGLDHARNTGWMQATAPIVAYTDDDVRLHTDWLGQLLKAFDQPQVQAVTGLVLADALDTEAQVIFEKYWSFNRGYQDVYYDSSYFRKHLRKGVPAWEIGAGASMAFRRSGLHIAGGFDPRLDVGAAGCNGDSEMWYRLMAGGWTIHYTPRAIAYHTHRAEKAALKKQIYYYLRGAACSLLVQHQRCGHRGNLYHLYKALPLYYLLSACLKFRYPRNRKYDTLPMEVKGYLSGISYFYKNRDFRDLADGPSLDRPGISNVLVSVIITAYNHARFLPDSIDSVLNQTFTPIELIVVDDGSTDHTRDVISRYPEIKYVFQPNRGLAAARNKGVQHSNGAFMVFLDADDLLYPDAIATNIRYMGQHPQSAFVSGWHDRIDENKKLIRTPEQPVPEMEPYHALLMGNYIGMHAAVMYRRQVFDLFRFDERLRACEDYDLYLQVARRYPLFSHTEKLAAYRIHGQNMSGDILLMRRQAKQVLDKNRPATQNPEAVKCYLQGKQNWDNYYAMEMYQKIGAAHLYPGYTLTGKHLLFVFRQLPAATMKWLVHKIKDKAWILTQKTMNAMKAALKQLLGYSMPGRVPRPGNIHMADLKRTTPFSREFGYDRGGPVDRYYIENFLQDNRDQIQGRVLEVGDNAYTRAFGGGRVKKSDILYIDDSNPNATIIGDLSKADHIASDQFDCIILTQTLHLIYDFQSAIRHCHRLLKPGGVLLLTAPGISQIDYGQWADTWYWSFTGRAISKLLTEYFGLLNVRVQTHGNVLAATAFLYGMGQNEISREEKDKHDPHYQVIITAMAVKD